MGVNSVDMISPNAMKLHTIATGAMDVRNEDSNEYMQNQNLHTDSLRSHETNTNKLR